MAQLTPAERLRKVRIGLEGTDANNYNDEQLNIFIDEIIDELIDGGVKREIAESTAAVGCLIVGVNDIWNYSSGGVKHSDFFYKRLIQLSKKRGDSDVSTE